MVHEECLWFDLQDLREVRLAPADVSFVEMLVNGTGAESF